MSVAISTELENGWTVLSARGDLDLGGAPKVRTAVRAALGTGVSCLLIDLSGVDVLDSTGIGVLIGALRRTRIAGGELRLRGLQPHHREVFALVGLDAVFAIDVDPAVQAVGCR